MGLHVYRMTLHGVDGEQVAQERYVLPLGDVTAIAKARLGYVPQVKVWLGEQCVFDQGTKQRPRVIGLHARPHDGLDGS